MLGAGDGPFGPRSRCGPVMQERNTTLPAADAGESNLDTMPGFRLGCRPLLRAGAECLRRLRDEELYLRRAGTWEKFCPRYLWIGCQSHHPLPGRIWPCHFEVAQFSRVSPRSTVTAQAPTHGSQTRYWRTAESILPRPEAAGDLLAHPSCGEIERRFRPPVTASTG